MEKFGAYHIFEEEKVVLNYYSGIITGGDFIHFMQVLLRDPRAKYLTSSVLDIRDAHLSTDDQGRSESMGYFKENLVEPGLRRTAYIVGNADQLIQTSQFLDKMPPSPSDADYKICYTNEAAADYLANSKIRHTELDQTIAELKQGTFNVFQKRF